ncbi:MAG: TonB-dependent receptor [Flavitalea sp.]
MQVSAGVYSQSKISLDMQSADIKKILSAIEKKSDFRFLYSQQLLKSIDKISVSANNEDVLSVLTRLLKNTAVSYELLDNNLIVLKAANTRVIRTVITGKVTDDTGQPVQGASVKIKGSEAGTTTDSAGNYSLDVPDGATLVFSFVGYAEQEISTTGKTTIDVSLVPGGKELEQVVVVGYGTQRKIDVTGSIVTVSGGEISKQPAPNAVSGLQGKVSGVQITNAGQPGAAPQIRIRGAGSVFGSTSPLFVVDGVWYDDINFLNPDDIESMNILKDASSEAIYGIRAANGVVLVTTKKGKSGKAVVNYTGFIGMQRVTNEVKMTNAAEYATLLNEKTLVNDPNATVPFANPSALGNGTNWYDQVFRNALITNHNISVSGGGEKSTYNFSLGYLKQEGIVKTNVFDRVTARFQNEFRVFEPLKIGYTITATANYTDSVPQTIFYNTFVAPPVVPVREADGSYGDAADYPTGNFANPQAQLDYNYGKVKQFRFTGNAYAELKILKDFTFRTSVGGEFGEAETRAYLPVYDATTVQRRTISQLTGARTEVRNFILENTLTYTKKINDHSFTVLAGQGAQSYQNYGMTGTALNVPNTSDGDLYFVLGDNGTRNVTDGGARYTIASYFGRLNYSFMNKYLLTASFRADGSSKFIGDQRWGYFPSVGLGWVITNESFMENQNVFDNLKLRGSWGQVGNVSVPNQLSVQTITQTPGFTGFFGNPSTPYTGASITTQIPPTTFWERGEGTDIALEMGLLNNRLNIEAGWYQRLTKQGIFAIPINGYLGTTSSTIIGNQGTFRNQGWEFSVNWKDNIGKDFSYAIGGNFAINDNRVMELTTGDAPFYSGGSGTVAGRLTTRSAVGQPLGQFYGFRVEGIFQDASEISRSAQRSAKPGDFRYADLNGNGAIDDGDRVILGNPNPRYNFGLNTNFTYKGFDLALDFQGVADVEIYNGKMNVRYGNENYIKEFYDNRWNGPGTSNTYPSANLNGDNLNPSNFYVEDGSYLRVRNAQLGYTFNQANTKRWGISRLRLFANAQNPFNWFKYRGFSPEVLTDPNNATGAINSGIDVNVYPLYATYNFGVNLTF